MLPPTRAWPKQCRAIRRRGSHRVRSPIASVFARRCSVPVKWSCRTGVCHTCETGLVSGKVSYQPDPLEQPAAGTALICCSQPSDELTLDL